MLAHKARGHGRENGFTSDDLKLDIVRRTRDRTIVAVSAAACVDLLWIGHDLRRCRRCIQSSIVLTHSG